MRPAETSSEPRDQDERDEADFVRLVDALRGHAGNVSKAATAVGISRQRAYRLIQARPQVDIEAFRAEAREDSQ